MRRENTPCNGFPYNDFRHSLTLFSKFFASFPHGTCSLSVSHPYLALDGIYHPFDLQSQANRLVEDKPYDSVRGTDGIVTLSDALFQGTSPRTSPGVASLDYNPAAEATSLQSGLIPLQSPLLGESLLVSFPPLSYMLKFSGSSCVTEAQVWRTHHLTIVSPIVHQSRCTEPLRRLSKSPGLGWVIML